MRDMTIRVMCDSCDCEEQIDLDNGSIFDDYDTRLENRLSELGWYTNYDGDWCPKCKDAALARWNA